MELQSLCFFELPGVKVPIPGCRTDDALFAAACSQTPAHAEVERSPVWLMRQAGRYMKAFKA